MDTVNRNNSIDIDFLPAKYREQFAQKKSQFWRVVASVVIVMTLMSASVWQWNNKRVLTAMLEEIGPIHEAAHGRTVQLTSLNNELAKLSARADLLIYLSHSWPKTQIIAAIVEPMPDSIKLSELAISRWQEENPGEVLPSQRARSGQSATSDTKKAAKSQEESLDRADLKQLRAEFDEQTTLVQLAGETTNVSELHMYLGEISQHPLIVKAELRSIESAGRDSDVTTFRARVFIKPGYGQPGGPTGTPKNDSTKEVAKTAFRIPSWSFVSGRED